MTLSRETLSDLTKQGGTTFVSIYLPMYRSGRERRQNRIRFKNLVDDALEFLSDEPDAAQAAMLSEELQRFRDHEEHEAWRHPGQGLAVFAAGGNLRVFTLPVEVDEQVHVGDRFYLKPLIRITQSEGRFIAVAISQKSARIFEGSSDSLRELSPEHLPQGLKEALNIDEYVSSLQYHSVPRTGDSGVIYHGHGGGEDDQKSDLLQYFHRLDSVLGTFLRKEDAPLVFAGVDYLFPIFKEAISYRNLLDRPVEGNFDDASSEQLHEAIWQVVGPYFKTCIDSVVAAYEDASGQHRTCDGLDEVLLAATRGAVETLLLRRGADCWGQMDVEGNVVRHDVPKETSLDLMDEAAYETLANGGRVFVFDDADFPGSNTPYCAILRYPVQSATAK